MRCATLLILSMWPGMPAAQVAVQDAATLRAAVEQAAPGTVIELAPGEYRVDRKITANAAGTAESPIVVRGSPGAEVLVSVPEGFHVRGPHWHFEALTLRGVCPDHSTCEHAFHITGHADGAVVRDCEMVDFNAHIKGNGEPLGPDEAYVWPDDVRLEFNTLYNTSPRQTGNPVTPIDVVGGRRWIVRGNLIHDHAKAGGHGISYAAFLKGNSRDGLFERNLVICELLHRGQTRLGLSFGGGGSGPPRICEDGTCTPEHQGGVMRNNIIANCPADVGIYINAGRDVHLLHNTLINTTGVDLRFESTTATVHGNLLDGRIRERDGGRGVLTDNQQADLATLFTDATNLDLTLRGDPPATTARTEPDDYCARPRNAQTHVGALDYAEPPCALRPPPEAPSEDPDMDPPDAEMDQGLPTDALFTDANQPADVPSPDAGPPSDTAPSDAVPDASTSEASTSGGCQQVPTAPLWLWLLLLLPGVRRARRSHPVHRRPTPHHPYSSNQPTASAASRWSIGL